MQKAGQDVRVYVMLLLMGHATSDHFPLDHPHLTCILHDYQWVTDISPRSREALPKCPLVSYRCPPNLKDLLVRAELKQQRETYKGSSPCKHPRCKACAHIKKGVVFNSTTTGHNFVWKPLRIVEWEMRCTRLSANNVPFNTSEKRRMHAAYVWLPINRTSRTVQLRNQWL